ncbi:DHHA1 domain-containing protein [Thermoanaerobacter thermohydrosulfuricus]
MCQSGAGLSYLIAKRVLKLANLPEIEDLIQLASLATVADLVPLKNNNWYIARKGLNSIREKPIKGILKILENSSINYKNIGGFEISWIISPRINAAGRLESPLLSYKLLLHGEGVDEIDKLNRQRIEIVNRCIEKIKDSENKFLIYVLENCPEGILGLIAGKVAEKFKKPVIVTIKEGTYIRGSARSVGEFNLIEAFNFISKKVDISFGGHKSACGVSFDVKDLNLIQQLLNEYVIQNPVEEEINELDGILVRKPSLEEVQNLDSFEPFGFKNPEPSFLLKGKIANIKEGNGWTLIKLDNEISYFGTLNYQIGQKVEVVVRPIIKNGYISMKVLDETPKIV